MSMKARVEKLVQRIQLSVFNTPFRILVAYDKKNSLFNARVYIQLQYSSFGVVAAGDNTAHGEQAWRGRKWYLSEHMTDDEIVKTVYAAFRMAVEHEVLEGFTVDGVRVFNPHTPFTELLKTGKVEETRDTAVRQPLDMSRTDLDNDLS